LAVALAGGVALAGLAAPPAAADYYDGIAAYENRDYGTAHRELQPLADAGDARAQRLVGLMYRDGLGVRQDSIRAYMWFELAARGGQSGAAELRNELAKRMQIAHIEEAERMAALWQPVRSYAGTESPIQSEDLPPASDYRGSMSRQQIADLQWQLAVHGYDPGASDGSVGRGTEAAIRRYQVDAGLRVDGQPSVALLEHLQYTEPPVMNRQVARAGGDFDDDFPEYGRPPVYEEPTGYGGPPPQVIGAAPSLMTVYAVTVQQELARRGYDPGPPDGVLGYRTRAAIRDYQSDYGLPSTGEVSLELVNHLRLVTAAAMPE
jgi:peptidoglycan hydrolase-like protein with peptidoglycan-binding domain